MQSELSTGTGARASILVVEDDEIVRDMLSLLIQRMDFEVTTAENGAEALEKLELFSFDLVLLDISMPEVDGYQVLQRIKGDLGLRHIPVIMLSGMSNISVITRCVELGADDFLTKPYNAALLKARMDSCLEQKRLRDTEKEFMIRMQIEQEKSERLLLNVLPSAIAQRLKQGEDPIADHFPDATVMFVDLVGFSRMAMTISPTELVEMLNHIFSTFDRLAEIHGLEKIKTIGDAYMVVGGVPNPRPDHAEAVAEMALAIRDSMSDLSAYSKRPVMVRIGINSGSVIAGIIGKKKFSYDLWGETVNLASRMESLGKPGGIQVGVSTYMKLRQKYRFMHSSVHDLKGMGRMDCHMLMGKHT